MQCDPEKVDPVLVSVVIPAVVLFAVITAFLIWVILKVAILLCVCVCVCEIDCIFYDTYVSDKSSVDQFGSINFSVALWKSHSGY